MTEPVETPELKPCPFCGRPAKFDPFLVNGRWWYYVGCAVSDCYGEMRMTSCEDEVLGSVKKWNRREGSIP